MSGSGACKILFDVSLTQFAETVLCQLNISWAWLTNAPMPHNLLSVFSCVVKATLLISIVYLYVLRVMAIDHLEFLTSSGEEFDYLFWSGAPIGISGEPKIPNVKCPRDGCQKGLSKGMQVLN